MKENQSTRDIKIGQSKTGLLTPILSDLEISKAHGEIGASRYAHVQSHSTKHRTEEKLGSTLQSF